MAAYPPGVPPVPPPGYDPREQRRYWRDQARVQRAAIRAQAQQVRYQIRSQRRGSVLGPVLLIAIGILFLLIQTGRVDGHHFFEWYGSWWPLLLVIAGVIVLAEWGFDQFYLSDPQRPAYRRSIGGGVIFLLLFLAITGAFARVGFHGGPGPWMFNGFQINPDNLDEFLGNKHESDQAMDFAFPAGSSLAVVNPRGDVTINGTSDDGRIHLAIHKEVWDRSDSSAATRAEKLTPEVQQPSPAAPNAPLAPGGSSALTITMPSLDSARSNLVITVPAEAPTTVTANRGDIHIASIKGPVILTANHGEVELSAITGPATAHINSGSSSISAHSMGSGITIEGRGENVTLSEITGPVNIDGDYFGTTHLEHIVGSIHFHTSRTDFQVARLDGQVEISPDMDLSADQAVGPTVLTTRDRNINLERFAGDVSVTNRNGSINLTAAPSIGNITLEDRNGSVKTILPGQAAFTVQAGTNDGNIDTDFQLSTSENGNHKNVNGIIGNGGPVVRITTTNGDISLRKGDILPLPPEPPALPRITLTPPPTPARPMPATQPAHGAHGAHAAKPAAPAPPAP